MALNGSDSEESSEGEDMGYGDWTFNERGELLDVSMVAQMGEACSGEEISSPHPMTQDERDTLAALHTLVSGAGEQREVLAELERHKHLLDRDIICSVAKSMHLCACFRQFEEYIRRSNDDGHGQSMSKWIMEGRCPHNQETKEQISSKRLIHVAAAAGNVWLLKYLLDQGCDINAQTRLLQLTPLFLTVTWEHFEAAKFLIGQGADASKKSYAFTPLMEAVDTAGASMVRLLLESPTCNVNETSNAQSATALKMATGANDKESIDALLAAGADPNIADKYKMTPLLDAAMSGRADIADVLMKAGADVNRSNYRNESPLLLSVHQNDRVLSKLLLEAGAMTNACSNDGFPALVIASYTDCVDIVSLLLEHGADINAVNESSYTSVHVAAWDGHKRTVEVLLKAGAKHDLRTKDLNTPLSLAAHGNHFSVVEQLLPLGCDVNNADKDRDTALHYASYNGCLKTVKALVSAGADPNARNRIGTTALWNAVYRNHIPVVQYLLYLNVDMEVASRGINQHSQTAHIVQIYDDPRSPLWVAVDRDNEKMIELLFEAGYKIWSENWVTDGSTDQPEDDSSWRRLADLISQPPSLLHMSKMYLRQIFGLQIHTCLHELEIPDTLKDYLALQGIHIH